MEVDVIEGDAGVEVKVHQNINNDRDAVEQSDVVDDASDSPHTERITSA